MATIDWKGRALSADDAVWIVKSGMNVFVHGAAATPTPLLEALGAPRPTSSDVTLYHLHTDRPGAVRRARATAGRFRSVSLFTGAPLREAVEEGRADFVPVFLSRHPRPVRDRARSRSTWRCCSSRRPTRTATARSARRSTPRWRRRRVGALHRRRDQRADAAHARQHARAHSTGSTRSSTPTGRCTTHEPRRADDGRGRRSASSSPDLVDDGATLQMGIGAIPDAVLAPPRRTSTTSAFTPRCSPTASSTWSRPASITNRLKKVHPGRIVTSFVAGTQRALRLRGRQPARRVPSLRPHQRHRASSARTTRWSRSTRRSRST